MARQRSRIYRVTLTTVIDVELRRELDNLVDDRGTTLTHEVEKAVVRHIEEWKREKGQEPNELER